MRYLRHLTGNWIPWLLIALAAAALTYLAGSLGSPGGPLAPRKWDGRYHSPAAKRSDRWRKAREESRAEAPAAGQSSPTDRP